MSELEVAREACDACRRRKVKCNRTTRCNQCTHLGLKCRYSRSSPSLRTRRAITRGAVIQAYRESANEVKSSNGLSAIHTVSASASLPHSPHEFANTAAFFRSLVAGYESQTLPLLPIITVSEYKTAIDTLRTDSAATSLLYVLASTTLNMTVPKHGNRDGRRADVSALCYAALEKRGIVMPHHEISIKTVMVSLLVATCLFTQDPKAPMGWYYFNEAVTCTALLCPSQHELNGQLKRLYWLIWIHERYNAIVWRRRPVLLTINSLPSNDLSLPPNVSSGFGFLIRLWRIMDDVFVQNWLDSNAPALTPAWIEGKHSQLAFSVDRWEDEIKSLSHKQQLDLMVTRHWMQTLLWQMALSKFLLKSQANEQAASSMSFNFPAHVSHRLRDILTSTPSGDIEAHGTGVVHKSFDIVCTLADLLEHVLHAMCDAETIAGYVDDFLFLYNFLTGMPDFHGYNRALLEERYRTLRDLYPQLLS